MAGVPFEPLERLATPDAARRARDLAARREELEVVIKDAGTFFESGEHLLSREAFRELRSAVRARRPPAAMADPQPLVFTNYADAAARVVAAASTLQSTLERAVDLARPLLVEAARTYLPRQLIFSAGSARGLLNGLMTRDAASDAEPKHRNTRTRERERHLLLYLQRVSAKNDSFSEFGPTSWGSVDATVAGFSFAPVPGITARETFLERWTAHAMATAINHDPEVFDELAPRLNPNGRRVNGSFVFTDSGEAVTLNGVELATLDRCDGYTRVHSLAAPEIVRGLAARKVVRCEIEVPALEPHAFSVLRDDVLAWRAGEVRDKWLAILQPIAALSDQFAATVETKDRQAILDEARARFQALGIERELGDRHLYSAANPIGEECFRRSDFRINKALINEVAVEAAPWIDLWRDCYAFVASRVAAGLRGVLESMPSRGGAVLLPAFLRACENARLPLTGPGLVVLAHLAFEEVKAAFREMMEPHGNKAEYELTVADCLIVRSKFEYPRFDGYTFPSADLQIAAQSPEAVARGHYQWVLAELHPPVALLHHGAYWSCPDHAELSRSLASTTCGRPNFHFGFFAADFTAHTAVRYMDALPELMTFVSAQRSNSRWRTVRPAEVEVFVDESNKDVCLRARGSHEYLGSFARAWLIPLGFHPFQFGMAPHMPRLRCGKVIVQRQCWTVTLEELPPGNYTGISRDLVLAIEQLRSDKDWPRHIYIRPTEQALRRSGAEGRDKDTKPVFIDLESYLFLEIFHRWLHKAGELEVTEMLPDPDHLCWQEADGRRTFELRTLIVPRS